MDKVSRRFFKPAVTRQADFHAVSPSEWQLACQREAVIRPLAEADRLSCLQVDLAAKILGLGRSVTYRLIARFRQRPQTSSLLLAKAGLPRSLRLAGGLQARVFAAAAWRTRQNHPFATGKRSSRVHKLTAQNSTN